ncbi:MAG TPA: nitrite reductase [Nocardioidaceae bacterium]|nr:nitrite reductase [Nocardioidaceae bacterium]
MGSVPVRTRADRCPGILRPWPAEDGPLVRIRLVGGRLTASQFHGLLALSAEYGDGNLHLTSRANVQVRAVRSPDAFASALEAIGLLPSRTHERVRNIVVSPGGALQPVAERFDALLCATPALAALPGRFLFGFDDLGDLADLGVDLGFHAGRWVIGGRLGAVLAPEDAPEAMVDLALRFLELRGDGPAAAWHVAELATPLAPAADAYEGVPDTGTQVDVPDGVLTPRLAAALDVRDHVVVTPWRGVLL